MENLLGHDSNLISSLEIDQDTEKEVGKCLLLAAHTEYLLNLLGIAEDQLRDIHKENIRTLHIYNRAKDIAQELLGVIARRKGMSLKECAETYSAPERISE